MRSAARRSSRARPAAAGLGAALLGVMAALGPAAAGHAADDGRLTEATIDHSEIGTGSLQLLVSVPGDEPIDLGTAEVTVSGQPAEVEATSASSSDAVARTTVLAIDTSRSMSGPRIKAAKSAAMTYLSTVPANVEVGIVTFDKTVEVRQEPSLDRDAARAVIEGLTLRLQTSLNAGVIGALEAAGTTGQRRVLVLSDGKDTTAMPAARVTEAVRASGVRLDVVSLGQGAKALAQLRTMADAGKGEVIDSNAKALTTAFANEADALNRQVLLDVTVPDGVPDREGNVEVAVASGGTVYTDAAFLTIRRTVKEKAASAEAAALPVPVPGAGMTIPLPVVLGGVGAIGVGVIGLLVGALGMSGPRNRPATLEQQLAAYGMHGEVTAGPAPAQSPIEQVKVAAEKALSSNQGLEAKIAKRLDGAGSSLKASEWLLLHALIAIAFGLLGLLLGSGSLPLLVLGLIAGIVLPWVFLSLKQSRRLKAFDAGLADTLQMMSGSLSAGLSMAQSIDTIVREGAEPICSEFRRVIVETQLGVGLEDALEGVAERMQSEDFEWVVMAIRIQREVGGNLAELLLNVAATLREREYLRRQVKALAAEGKLSAYVLGGLPPIFLLYLTATKGDYVHPLYTTPIGWLMLGGMGLLLSVGMFWMLKVAKVDV